MKSLITNTLAGRVKLAYANNQSDEEIAAREGITVEEVAVILEPYRLCHFALSAAAARSSAPLIKATHGSEWPK